MAGRIAYTSHGALGLLKALVAIAGVVARGPGADRRAALEGCERLKREVRTRR